MVLSLAGTAFPTGLYAANTLECFWHLLAEPQVSPAEWEEAATDAASLLPQGIIPPDGGSEQILANVFGEILFGTQRWQLSRSKQLYYRVKPYFPRPLAILLRQFYRRKQEQAFVLGWPLEDRYVRFQMQCIANLLRMRGMDTLPFLHFWPDHHRFALVLTHDIEEERGAAFVEQVADLEEELGFRSVFNFVPERYPIDQGLQAALRARGFEVGIHGLKHDGKLFASRQAFEQRAAKINGYLHQWQAVGFRTPYMHRHPEWLQALDVEYDLSFFDTDPYEPQAGGTMSIWPFMLGAFVELPYTLVQDHTLTAILKQTSPRLWLEKVDFLERSCGMALVNVHPDYLRKPTNFALYRDFLLTVKQKYTYWHALPRSVAQWWRQRSTFKPELRQGTWNLADLPGATMARLVLEATGAVSIRCEETPLKTVHEEKQSFIESIVREPEAEFPTEGVGAVILGGDYQGLGIAQSLGRKGIPICIIDDEFSIARFSRYVTYNVRVPNLRDECRTIEAVLGVGKQLKLDGWVLYPTRDETVAAFSRHRAELMTRFRVPTPAWNAVRWAWDKRNTYRLAQELGIPTPRTWYPRTGEEVAAIDAALPLVIKPAIKEHFIYATKAKAWRADSRAELVQRFQQALELVGDEEIMIQELVPGDGQQQFSYCAFFKEGQARGSMTCCRRRQHPAEFGRSSTFVETVDLPIIAEYSERFLKAIDYYGLVEIEYKRDLRDGQYKLLDFNARTWGYHSLGQSAGVDFPYLLFTDQLGGSVEPVQARAGVRWMRFVTDLPTEVLEIFKGAHNWQDYVHSLKGIQKESVFSRDDLMPGLIELLLVPYLYIKRGF